ncbi:hypothetical protein GGI12_002453 [Dipsacomyces acuminosporus]|nr:hypothetical protein GGI12_002453 [Dipsacomyces acuminosporus]
MSSLAKTPAIGIDIGGSLAKFALVDSPESQSTLLSGDSDAQLPEHPLEKFIRDNTKPSAALPHGWHSQISSISILRREGESRDPQQQLRALWLPASDLVEAIDRIAREAPSLSSSHAAASGDKPLRVHATGGGALNYKKLLETKLRVDISFINELEAVSKGWRFDVERVSQAEEIKYPALICNVGTGVSMVSVDKDNRFERVTGSGIGGTTFWSLTKRLTKFTSFDQAILAAVKEGNANKADTLVGDIYGKEASEAIGMPPDLVAGFLGKLSSPDVSDADISAALLRMTASNLGQLAVFQAQKLSVDTIWFTGGFLQSPGDVTQQAVAQAVAFWSAGKIAVRFPQNASLLGALGAVAVHLEG